MYKKEGHNEVQLKEVGPRFELRRKQNYLDPYGFFLACWPLASTSEKVVALCWSFVNVNTQISFFRMIVST